MEKGNWDINDDILLLRNENETFIPNASEIYQFIFTGKSTIGGIIPANDPTMINGGINFSKYPLKLIIEISLLKDHKINLCINAEVDKNSIQIEDFFNRIPDHIILNGIWYPFIKGIFSDIKNTLGAIGITKPGVITLKQYLFIRDNHDLYLRDLAPQQLDAKEISKLLVKSRKNVFFTGNLFPYQEQGYNWLAYIDQEDIGCILADEMGLGKTIQVIALLADHAGSEKPCLVIAPATLMENWRREFQKFTSGLRIYLHKGAKRSGLANDLKQYNVIITSYETVIRDRYMLKMIDWDMVILDEAQAIKNPEAKRTKAVKSLPRRSSIAMSGTPVQNNLIDLWSIIDFSLPGLFGSLTAFEKEFTMDTDSAKRIEPLVSPVILRRRIEEVAKELPEKIDIPQPMIMDDKSIQEYEEIRRQTIEDYGNKASFVVLQKLRMYCAHPTLVTGIDQDPVIDSVKYNRLLEILDEIFANNQKVLIFTSWTKMVDILVEDIPKRFGVYANKIDGSIKIIDRQGIVDTFNEMDRPGILVLNPIAGGVGLNITGANHVIHYNLEWNPAVVDQATARSYRKGQIRPVTVHRFYYVDTVEDVINERLDFKREIATKAVIGVKGKDEDIEYIYKALKISPRGGKTDNGIQ